MDLVSWQVRAVPICAKHFMISDRYSGSLNDVLRYIWTIVDISGEAVPG